MKKMYTIALLLVIILFVSNSRKKEEVNVDNTLDDQPLINKIVDVENEEKNPILGFFNNIFKKVYNVVTGDVVPVTEESKIKVLEKPNITVDESEFNIKGDILSPNPIDSTEYRFVDENPKIAWSKVNVSQHPKHYTSNFTDELTNTGKFFDDNMMYNDKTSPYSKTILPDRCYLDNNSEVICNYNNRLQNIPPSLIMDKNNKVIQSIGQGKGDIYKSIEGKNVDLVNDNYYQSWDYVDDKTINGGDFFNGIKASEPSNEQYLSLDSINMKKNYSI